MHALPFYPQYDGADAGFDPDEHTAVDPRLGNWAMSRTWSATATWSPDLIANHRSAPFRDVVEPRGPQDCS